MAIHPTSVISKEAEIDEGVEIGPFCVVTGRVRIGKGTILHSHVSIGGRHASVEIGERNEFYHGTSLGSPPQDITYQGEDTQLIIGNDNQFREAVTVSTGTKKGGGVTRLGNKNLLMAYTHFGHDCVVGDENIIANSTQFAGHVELGNRVYVGGVCAFNQFVRVGDCAFIGGYSAINKDILPYSIAQGNYAVCRATNKVGLKRAGFSPIEIESIHNAIRILIKGSATIKEGLQRIKEECSPSPYLDYFVSFVESSERGVAK